MPRPKRLGDVLSELVARRGFGRVISTEELQQAWTAAVGDKLAPQTRVGAVRRGVLEVTVSSSVLVQELTFQRAQLLAQLAEKVPDQRISDLRFRCGTVS